MFDFINIHMSYVESKLRKNSYHNTTGLPYCT